MVTVTSVLRRSSTVTLLDNCSSSGESSRRPSAADPNPPRRSSLAGLSLRLPRSKRSNSSKEADTSSDIAARKLGEAFFSLPDEIIVQIFCYLSLTDIFALRLTSRSVYHFLQAHATPITRAVLRQYAYDNTSTSYEGNVRHEKAEYTYSYIQTLYPQPLPCNSTNYLMLMIKRQSQIDKMLDVIANFVQMKVYMFPSCPRFRDFTPYKLKLMRRLHLAAWTVYHFLDHYREMLVLEHPNHSQSPSDPPSQREEHGSGTSSSSCPKCAEFIRSLLPLYPGTEVIPAYHFYDLSRQHLRSLSRAPTYAGSIERRLRGWSRKVPTKADLATFIVLGGIPELCKLSMLKGTYNQRIEVIGAFVDKVSNAATQRRLTGETNTLPVPPTSNVPSPENTSISASSFLSLTTPLLPPFLSISDNTLSSIPGLDQFIVDSDEWIIRMFELVGPEDRIVTAYDFVQNVLAGKGEHRSAEDGNEAGTKRSPSDVDFLAPVKTFGS
ncbi:uncharacterized protein Z518_00149 [Rhinocladiella mackenziei CBS 650.93]|uniref:F-box domain-containing protein n=1 Tax=Rhinocladiella mackenziei CBS 650.93 TaxID=1442369 RepID=A0A0D2J0B8_9EURO|nr:uncharacterized protein Z518_00149 [Rhinocladiella mackenziei CBS 650.93]KIX09071.1 hypothetical protein Z518_00149 [Rhinocladiella mackenziei CBS 650.93]